MCKVPFKSQLFGWNVKLYQRWFNMDISQIFAEIYYFANVWRLLQMAIWKGLNIYQKTLKYCRLKICIYLSELLMNALINSFFSVCIKTCNICWTSAGIPVYTVITTEEELLCSSGKVSISKIVFVLQWAGTHCVCTKMSHIWEFEKILKQM